MKNTFFIVLSLFLCACTYNTGSGSSEKTDGSVYQAGAAGSSENTIKNSAATVLSDSRSTKEEENYCSKIRRFKVAQIGGDFVIAGECSDLLPDKVCLVPKTQYVYFKKKQLEKINVKIIYDGLIFTIPEKKCARFTDSYTYKTKIDNVSELIFGEKSDTTIPVAEIAGRY